MRILTWIAGVLSAAIAMILGWALVFGLWMVSFKKKD